jgi:hypothetical protein
MIWRSCNSGCRSLRSTTLNHAPLPALVSTSISTALAPWVSARENSAKLSFGLFCPVRSGKL